MKMIPLSQGLVAIVDDDDFDRLSKFKWHAHSNGGPYYAVRGTRIKKERRARTVIQMHREIMSAPKRSQLDHINGNGLDNRKANLRFCTQAQNMANQHKRKSHSSRFKGVSWNKNAHAWHTYITQGTTHHLGYFDSELEAAKAYDRKALELFGEFARLNLSGGVKA